MDTIHTKKKAPAWADVDDEERQYYKIKKNLEKYLYKRDYYNALNIILNEVDLQHTIEVFERFNNKTIMDNIVPIMIYFKKYMIELYDNILALIDENIYDVLIIKIEEYDKNIDDIIDIEIEDEETEEEKERKNKKQYVVKDIFRKKKGILKKKDT